MTVSFAPPSPPPLSPQRAQRRREALEALASMAAVVAPETLDSALLTFSPSRHGAGTGPAVTEQVDAPLVDLTGLNPHGALLRDAAAAAGYLAEPVSAAAIGATERGVPAADTALRLTINGALFYYHRQLLSRATPDGRLGDPINGAAAPVLYSKYDTKAVLAAAGVPVPAGRRFQSGELAAALRYAATCPGPLCVKHDTSANGWLVLPGLCSAEEVAGACATVARFADAFVVEEHVPGEAWRFFWVAPAIVGIKVGRPASVVGDGARTVRALLHARNAERRPLAEAGIAPPLREGAEMARVLAWQGLALDAVPAPGATVFLSLCSNGTRGADSLARRERLHPGYVAAMTRAFQAIPGVQVAAADVMIADPSVPPEAGRYAVVEINVGPSLLAYHHPAAGPVQDVSGAIVGLLGRLAGGMA